MPGENHKTPELSDQHIGEMIRRLRESLGWSQSELARRVNLSIRYICRIEAGRDPWISAATIEQIANVFGLTSTQLIGSEPLLEPMPKPKSETFVNPPADAPRSLLQSMPEPPMDYRLAVLQWLYGLTPPQAAFADDFVHWYRQRHDVQA